MRERLLAGSLLLSALVFATPLSPIAGDPYPHLGGTALALVFALPTAVLLLLGGARPGPGWILCALVVWAACVARPFAAVSDTLEARRALLGLALLPLAFAGGAALEARGRALFSWGLVLLSCGWTLGALCLRGSFAGVLGDSGSLSQAALPGAALGAGWLVSARGLRRYTGGAALALFLVHVGVTPVLAGSHTLLAGLLCAAWRARAGRERFAALSLVALLAPFVGMAGREWASGAVVPIEGARAESSRSLGGLGVRGLVWSAALGLVADHPWTGAGPGQFQAAFPPYRDPREIELSRHGVCSELDTEVEHAHNDYLQLSVELGLVGGALFLAFAWRVARRALAALGEEDSLAPALAALALLVNAAVHAPLSANPASAGLALALFGSLFSHGQVRRLAAFPMVLPALLAVPCAPAMIRHGAALCDYVRHAARIAQEAALPAAKEEELERRRAELELEAAGAQWVLRVALAVAPDSAPARLLAARLAPAPERVAAFDAVLAVRPHSAEAWEQSGTDQARVGASEDARRRYHAALALSPTHPRLLKNLARLECVQGDPAQGRAALERLRSSGCLAEGHASELAAELVLELGSPERGAALLSDTPFELLVPEQLNADAQAEGLSPALVATKECLAHLLWARDHARHASFANAVRSYRQALARSRARRGDEGAPLFRLELAAAEAAAGRRADALADARAVPLDAGTWERLPEWARATLLDLGLAAPE